MTITRRWQAGFETKTTNEFDSAWSDTQPTISNTQVKTGGWSMFINRGVATNVTYIGQSIPATRQIRGGFSMYGVNSGVNATYFLQFRSISGELIRLELDISQGLHLVVNGTDQGSIAGFADNTWKHLSYDMKIDSSAGWVKVYWDGTLVLSFAGNTGDADLVLMRVGKINTFTSGLSAYFDDFYIDDTTGEDGSATPPIPYFSYIPLEGNGNYNGNWSGSDGNSVDNYLLLDEVPPGSDTDYIETNVVDTLESFTMATFALAAGQEIQAMIPFAYCRRTGVTEQIALGTRYSATDLLGSDQVPPNSYGFKFERQTTKPGGGSWDQAALDAVEFVAKSRGIFS